jgi:hypothetical protein
MPKALEPGTVVEVTAGFVCPAGTFAAGQLYYADDPIVRKYPNQFRPLRVLSTVKRTVEAPVEQATAAPGEKRGAR